MELALSWSDVKWGSAPEWLGLAIAALAAVATIAAVVISLYLIRRDAQRARDLELLRRAEDRRRDLDEVRRLVYMVIASKHQGATHASPEVGGTIYNAVIHHGDVALPELRHRLTEWLVGGCVLDDRAEAMLTAIVADAIRALRET